MTDHDRYIAERLFESDNREIILRVGLPFPDPAPGGDWGCAYEIAGLRPDRTGTVFGADSLQALLLAIGKARAELEHHRRSTGLSITWLGLDELGLP